MRAAFRLKVPILCSWSQTLQSHFPTPRRSMPRCARLLNLRTCRRGSRAGQVRARQNDARHDLIAIDTRIGVTNITTVQITLPDQLAQEAQRAGLLTSATMERMLREQLKASQSAELFSAMDRMAEIDSPAAMSPEEVAEEIRAMRAERRTKNAG